MPVVRSTRSGQYARTARRTASNPFVRAATYSSSTRFSRIAMCSRPLASERSVFGTGCRWVCASSAVAVRRGSITTCRAPRSRPSSRKRIAGGIVSAGLLPTSTSTSAFGMSSNGNGRPRSIPNARVPAATADDMQNRPL